MRETEKLEEKLFSLRKRMVDLEETIMDTEDFIDQPELPVTNDRAETLYVIEFAPDVSYESIEWLVKKLTAKKNERGAELVVRREPYDPSKGFRLHISATSLRLVEIADSIQLRKADKNGKLREFSCALIEKFTDSLDDVADLFNSAEKQALVRHEMDNLRATPAERFLPGYSTVRLYHGQSIVEKYFIKGLIQQIYPLHEPERLVRLGHKWYKAVMEAQPFDEIRQYLGQAVALYFSFLGFYTSALVVPAILGCIQLLLLTLDANTGVAVFCIFNVVWSTIFLEMWTRKSNELAYTWGTLTAAPYDTPRANYRGKLVMDAVTGELQPYYPRWKTLAKLYGASMPLVLVCLTVAFYIMLLSFWADNLLLEMQKDGWGVPDIAMYVPSIIYTLIVVIMNRLYRELATRLTEWENHRTQSQFDRNRVSKLVLFEFVNNFMSLFYIAFYLQDVEMLKVQVATMLIILQFVNHFEEALLPLALRYGSEKVEELLLSYLAKKKRYRRILESRLKKDESQSRLTADEINNLKLDEVNPEEPIYKQAIEEGMLENYYGTTEDYLELFIQFGYVFLFSAVYPLAALFALLNNLLEIRADAFKMCKVYQRPATMRARHIGAWQPALQALCALSVITNCGLLYLSPQLRNLVPGWSEMTWLLFWVSIEHLLLGIQAGISLVIPSVPGWVRKAMAKTDYDTRFKLREKKHIESRKNLIKFSAMKRR